MIILKTPDEIQSLTRACRIVGETLGYLKMKIEPGITTRELDQLAEDYIKQQDATPAFKGYRGYPASVCASVNNEVIHGIPSDRVMKEGDILSLDLGVYKDGFYGDAAYTYPIGSINEHAELLLRTTEESLYAGIENAFSDRRLTDISHAIQQHVESKGFSVVRAFVGHGIGRDLHEDPQVPNFGRPGHGPKLRAGMALAIEPMVNAGGHEVFMLDDGWTAVTMDGSLSAHFEHTVLITDAEPEILTKIE
jgi:methionyl aminopeptidase